MQPSTEKQEIWFPEPTIEDNTFDRRGESTIDWLARSTVPRAEAARLFLNENLCALPLDAQNAIFKNLRAQWNSAFFELVVARVLQELGATLEVERTNTDGKRPDFTADFDDTAIVVEAISPVFDPGLAETEKSRARLLDIIEESVPTGWCCGVWALPAIGLSQSIQDFKRKVVAMVAVAPPTADHDEMELVETLPEGDIHLILGPRRNRKQPIIFEPAMTVFDRSIDRIRYALRSKKRQIRNSQAPVLLAINAAGISSDFEDFDRALFGSTAEFYDEQFRNYKTEFVPDGVFTVKRDSEPNYAGALAFLHVGFPPCPVPILYRHPRYKGMLPQALTVLEQRTYDLQINAIVRTPGTATNLMDKLHFVKK